MASTNKTPNIQLSQFIGTDKPSWLSDYNSDMLKIDTAVAGSDTGVSEAKATANNALSVANQANSKSDTNTSSISTINGQIQTINNNITTVEGIANNATTLANNANQGITNINNGFNWTHITFSNPNSALFTGYTITGRYNKQLGLLSLFGRIQISTGNLPRGTVICTLPEAIRPNETKVIYLFCMGTSNTPNDGIGFLTADLGTNGNITSDANFDAPYSAIYFNEMLCMSGWQTT